MVCVTLAERRYAAAVDALPEAEKTYIALAVNEGLDNESIAELLGLERRALAELAGRTIAGEMRRRYLIAM